MVEYVGYPLIFGREVLGMADRTLGGRSAGSSDISLFSAIMDSAPIRTTYVSLYVRFLRYFICQLVRASF